LLKIKKKQSQSIILFNSPQALKKHSVWHPVFKELFSRQLFSLLVIYEAHCVEHQQGRSFCPEFKEGLQEFSNIANSFVHILIVAMSATFPANDQQALSNILKDPLIGFSGFASFAALPAWAGGTLGNTTQIWHTACVHLFMQQILLLHNLPHCQQQLFDIISFSQTGQVRQNHVTKTMHHVVSKYIAILEGHS
jgi:hypothetical protein